MHVSRENLMYANGFIITVRKQMLLCFNSKIVVDYLLLNRNNLEMISEYLDVEKGRCLRNVRAKICWNH